jgi:hypothetical protein
MIGKTNVTANTKIISRTSIIKITEYRRGILYSSNFTTSGLNKYATTIDIKHGKIIGRTKNNVPIIRSNIRQTVA